MISPAQPRNRSADRAVTKPAIATAARLSVANDNKSDAGPPCHGIDRQTVLRIHQPLHTTPLGLSRREPRRWTEHSAATVSQQRSCRVADWPRMWYFRPGECGMQSTLYDDVEEAPAKYSEGERKKRMSDISCHVLVIFLPHSCETPFLLSIHHRYDPSFAHSAGFMAIQSSTVWWVPIGAQYELAL